MSYPPSDLRTCGHISPLWDCRACLEHALKRLPVAHVLCPHLRTYYLDADIVECLDCGDHV